MHILVKVDAAGAALGLVVAAVRTAGVEAGGRRGRVASAAVGGYAARGAGAEGDVCLGRRDGVGAVCVVVGWVVVALAAGDRQGESGGVILRGGVGRHVCGGVGGGFRVVCMCVCCVCVWVEKEVSEEKGVVPWGGR